MSSESRWQPSLSVNGHYFADFKVLGPICREKTPAGVGDEALGGHTLEGTVNSLFWYRNSYPRYWLDIT